MSWKYQVLRYLDDECSLEYATDCPDYLPTVRRAVEWALNDEWEEGLIDVTFDNETLYVAIWKDDVFQGVYQATAEKVCPNFVGIVKTGEPPKGAA